MDCSCQIDIDIGDYAYEEVRCKKTTAIRNFKCCECRTIIPAGTEHWIDIVRGDWVDPPRIDVFRTCLDCLSVRQEVFCNFQFSALWEMLYNFLEDDGLIPEACIVRLTPKAREAVCNAIEEVWDQMDDEEDD